MEALWPNGQKPVFWDDDGFGLLKKLAWVRERRLELAQHPQPAAVAAVASLTANRKDPNIVAEEPAVAVSSAPTTAHRFEAKQPLSTTSSPIEHVRSPAQDLSPTHSTNTIAHGKSLAAQWGIAYHTLDERALPSKSSASHAPHFNASPDARLLKEFHEHGLPDRRPSSSSEEGEIQSPPSSEHDVPPAPSLVEEAPLLIKSSSVGIGEARSSASPTLEVPLVPKLHILGQNLESLSSRAKLIHSGSVSPASTTSQMPLSSTSDVDLKSASKTAKTPPLRSGLSNSSSIYSGRGISNAGAGTIGTKVPKSLQTLQSSKKRKNSFDDDEGATPSTTAPSCPNLSTFICNASPAAAVHFELPEWYTRLSINPRTRFDRSILALLQGVREAIGTLKLPSSVGAKRAESYSKIRDQVHRISTLDVTDVLVKKSKLLEPASGFPQIFAPALGGRFGDCPFDVSADAREVFLRWCCQEFNPDILRGIDHSKGSGSVLKDYPNRSAAYFGEGDLVPGQWWPSWICMYRDGAHGVVQGGIYGETGQGARSIVVAGHTGYEDVDEGDVVQYTGTEGSSDDTKRATQLMRSSLKTQRPIRVMRSHRLPQQNPYRPEYGVRYDGLYKVTAEKLLNSAKSHWLFTLARIPGQSPIRHKGPAARPYAQEVDAWKVHPARAKFSD